MTHLFLLNFFLLLLFGHSSTFATEATTLPPKSAPVVRLPDGREHHSEKHTEYTICQTNSECDEETEFCSTNNTETSTIKYCVCKPGFKPGPFTIRKDTQEIALQCIPEDSSKDFGEICQHDNQCFNNMICKGSCSTCISTCTCPSRHFFNDEDRLCYEHKGLGHSCEKNEQCPYNADCRLSEIGDLRKECRCKDHLVQVGDHCQFKRQTDPPPATSTNNNDYYTALQIYKITMILASCCLGLVLIMFLVCILKKTYCPSHAAASREGNRGRRASSIDVSVIFPADSALGSGVPFNCRPPYEKPPTYDESERFMRDTMGVPPPAYDAQQQESPSPACLLVSSSTTVSMPSSAIGLTATSSHQRVCPPRVPEELNIRSLNSSMAAANLSSPSTEAESENSDPSSGRRKRPTRSVPLVIMTQNNGGRPRHPDPDDEGVSNMAFIPD